jgi:hypothetical protein
MLAAYARADMVGVWRRGSEQTEVSCRHALSLLGKGFEFVGLADENRRRAVAEARPSTVPDAATIEDATPRRAGTKK